MSENTIVLRGKVREFAKSYSGNLSFTLEDSQNNLHYCFSTKKSALAQISDDVIIFGSYTSGNKVRINYIINNTRNSEQNLVEAANDWMYYLSLISAILVSIGLVIGVLIVVGIIPINFGSMWGILGSLYSIMIFLILIIALVPGTIIFWVLTNSFSKKRKAALYLNEEISRIKNDLSGSLQTPILTPKVVNKPSSEQKERDLHSPRSQFCAHCGTEVSFEGKFCPSCGSEQ